MKHRNDEILRKYIAGDIEIDHEKCKILELDKEIITRCEGKTLLALGEMTLVVGGKNSGKSKFINQVIKQILIEKCEAGFVLSQGQDFRVISFDSEMGIDRLIQWGIIGPYEDEYGPSFLKEKLVNKLYLYSLKKLSPYDRISYISDVVDGLKNENPNTHFIICIDVGTCLTSDTNSSLNGGLIDILVNKLSGNTLIVTIHHSLKDESKSGIGMGSIGTALEKLCAIKLLVNPTDNENRHKVEFLLSKYEDVNKDRDYFFLHTEKDDDGKIHINGLSDSLGVVIRKKGNSKVDYTNFKDSTLEFIINSVSIEDSYQKNIAKMLMDKYNLQPTAVYDKLKKLKEEEVVSLVDGRLFIK
jgi:hypothetical protein